MIYFYFWGLLFVLPLTCFAFIKSNKYEKIKMILSGTCFGIISVIISYCYLYYWHPVYLFDDYHIEDFIYGFIFAGMLTVVHNLLCGNRMSGKLKFNFKIAIAYNVILFSVFFVTTEVLNKSFYFALCIVPVIVGVISFIVVKGRLVEVAVTMLVSVVITVVVYNLILTIYPAAVINHFYFQNMLGEVVLNIPLEEWIFALCIGFGSTYAYESLFNMKADYSQEVA